jgi:hypothetical protein
MIDVIGLSVDVRDDVCGDGSELVTFCFYMNESHVRLLEDLHFVYHKA